MSTTLPVPYTPRPWRWQCHKCYTWYTLSCTRRCLECSHVFCQKRQPSHNDNTNLFGSLFSPRLLRKYRNEQRKGRKKRSGPCESEFDFEGWAAWGSWRRMTLLRSQRSQGTTTMTTTNRLGRKALEQAAYVTWKPKVRYSDETRVLERWFQRPAEKEAEVLKRKEEMYLRGEHDCSLHCDWPNECGYAVYAAKGAEAGTAGWDSDDSDESGDPIYAAQEGETATASQDSDDGDELGKGNEFGFFEDDVSPLETDDVDDAVEQEVSSEPQMARTIVEMPASMASELQRLGFSLRKG